MHTYKVYTYDVWGNPKDGFEVNDRYHSATITMKNESDKTIFRILKDIGIIPRFDRFSSYEIDGDTYALYVNKQTRELGLFPVCELIAD